VLFTGDLNRSIESYPAFPGSEAHYLKCQLARITHASFLGRLLIKVPRGVYKVNDETQEVEFDEEGKMPELGELASLDNWVHFHSNILQAGRVTHYISPLLNEEVPLLFRIARQRSTGSTRPTPCSTSSRPLLRTSVRFLLYKCLIICSARGL